MKCRFWWVSWHFSFNKSTLRTWQQTGNCDNGACSKHSSGSGRCHQLRSWDRGLVRDFDTRMTEIPYNSWLTRFVCLFAIHIILGWTNHDSFITAFFNQKVLQICWCNFQTCTTHETSSFGFHFNSVSKEGCHISMHLVRWHTGSLRAGLPHFLLMLEETYWRVIWVDRWGALNNGRRESYETFFQVEQEFIHQSHTPGCYCLFTSQSYNPSNELGRFCPTNEWTLNFLLNNTTCSTSTWHRKAAEYV